MGRDSHDGYISPTWMSLRITIGQRRWHARWRFFRQLLGTRASCRGLRKTIVGRYQLWSNLRLSATQQRQHFYGHWLADIKSREGDHGMIRLRIANCLNHLFYRQWCLNFWASASNIHTRWVIVLMFTALRHIQICYRGTLAGIKQKPGVPLTPPEYAYFIEATGATQNGSEYMNATSSSAAIILKDRVRNALAKSATQMRPDKLS